MTWAILSAFLLVDVEVGEIERQVGKAEPEPVVDEHPKRLHRLQKNDVADIELKTAGAEFKQHISSRKLNIGYETLIAFWYKFNTRVFLHPILPFELFW